MKKLFNSKQKRGLWAIR